MVVSGGAVSPENRSNEAREIAEQYLYDGDGDRPLNAGYYALLDVADSVAALESDLVGALARIAAVEALCNEADKPQDWRDLMFDGTPFPRLLNVDAVRAALVASPTPTGPETKPKRCAGTLGDRPSWMSPGQFSPCRCELLDGHGGECQCEHTRPATPTEPTEETQ